MFTRFYVEVFSNYLFKALYRQDFKLPFLAIIFIDAQLLREKQG